MALSGAVGGLLGWCVRVPPRLVGAASSGRGLVGSLAVPQGGGGAWLGYCGRRCRLRMGAEGARSRFLGAVAGHLGVVVRLGSAGAVAGSGGW